MALVKFGGGIVQMSGSIAGNTFARNRYGNYVRARTKPVNPNTDRQSDVRAAIAFLADRWAQTLTADQRTAWGLYAASVGMKNKLGETIHLSGFNHYIRSNAILKQVGEAPVDEGPVVFELPAQDPTYTITASFAAQEIEHTFDIELDWAVEDGALMFLFQGQPQNPQRNFFAGPWRWNSFIRGTAPGPNASPATRAITFPIAEGQRQWMYARISRADGRLSEPFRADCLIDA